MMTAPDFGRPTWASFLPLTSTSLIASAFFVCAGRAVEDEAVVTPKLVTAGVVILLGLTFMNQVDQLFAAAIAMLILVAVFLQYGPDVLSYVGVNLSSED